ncbi:hypothetical protein PCANB_002325 [Pneumocystis canis]|nr:hypothetical protein PCANB_002325 [Pneumocystis canis]
MICSTGFCLILSVFLILFHYKCKSLKRIAILGVQGVGKTSFFTKLCYNDKQKSYTSIQLNESIFCSSSGKKVILIDFPGHSKFYYLFNETKYIQSVIFMVDTLVITKNAFYVAQQLYSLLKEMRIKKIKNLLIAINKDDLFTTLPISKVSLILEEKLSEVILSYSKSIFEMDEKNEDYEWLINMEGKILSHGITLSKSDIGLVKLNDEKALIIREKYENQQEKTPMELFFNAVKEGDLNLIEKMYKFQEITLDVSDDQGVTALHWASIYDRMNVGRYLILNGMDVNVQDDYFHATPLHWAAKNGNLYMVHMLHQYGAYLHLVDVQGFTPLHLAIHRSNVMLVLYLLYQNVQIDCLDNDNRTPLIWAAYNGDELIVDLLLRWGANVKLQDKQGMTALHWAIVKGDKMCIKRLIEAGSDLLLKGYNGKTPQKIAKEMDRNVLFERVLYETGKDASGKLKRRFLSSKSSNIILFWGPLLVIGFLIWIFTVMSIFFSMPLVLLFSVIFHQFFVRIVSTESDPFFIIYKTVSWKYLAGIFFGSYIWVILRWLFVLFLSTWESSFFLNILFFIVSFLSIVCFFYTMFSNPGYIPRSQRIDEQREIIEDLIKERVFEEQYFCVSCCIRRPLRRIVLFIRLLFIHYQTINIPELSNDCFISSKLCKPFLLDPFTTILALWISFQFIWVMFLLISQIIQISFSITTNEAINLHKYGFMGGIEHVFYKEDTMSRPQSAFLNNQDPHYNHSRKKKHHVFWVLPKLLGIHHFLKIVNMFPSKSILQLNKARNPFDNGVLSNCKDFWCVGTTDIFRLGIMNRTKQSYTDGFGYIKGQLVNYYYLYDFLPLYKDLNKNCQNASLEEI